MKTIINALVEFSTYFDSNCQFTKISRMLKDKSKNREKKTWECVNFATPDSGIENAISAKKMSARLVW